MFEKKKKVKFPVDNNLHVKDTDIIEWTAPR